MTPDLDRIRKTHANALANRERGVIDSRDDDIGVLLGEVERLSPDNIRRVAERIASDKYTLGYVRAYETPGNDPQSIRKWYVDHLTDVITAMLKGDA